MNTMLLNIFDYRIILRQELVLRSGKNPRYSQRAFARDLDLAPHRLSEVLNGKQGLSLTTAQGVAKKLGWKTKETKHFCDLVESQHARSPSRKEAAKNRVKLLQTGREDSSLKVDSFEMVATWYHLAIIEWMKTQKIVTPQKVSTTFGINLMEADDALERLSRLKMIAKKTTGYKLLKGDNHVSTELPSLAIKKFHEANLQRAESALFTQSMEERHFSTSYIAVPESFLPQAKSLIEDFWQKFFAEAALYGPADRIYTLGINFHRTTT